MQTITMIVLICRRQTIGISDTPSIALQVVGVADRLVVIDEGRADFAVKVVVSIRGIFGYVDAADLLDFPHQRRIVVTIIFIVDRQQLIVQRRLCRIGIRDQMQPVEIIVGHARLLTQRVDRQVLITVRVVTVVPMLAVGRCRIGQPPQLVVDILRLAASCVDYRC